MGGLLLTPFARIDADLRGLVREGLPLLRVPVATVAQDVESIGRQAFGMLGDPRRGARPLGDVLVPPRLVVR